jgi:AcrR family transcriptional regulator
MDNMEQRIIEAAIACIEEFGFNDITVRRIAVKAGVNTAAINYYFRTKEQLIDKVIEVTLHNAFDWSDLQDTEDLGVRDQLLAIMEHLTEGGQNFPEMTRAHFFESMVNGNYDTRAVKELNAFMETMLQKFMQKGCKMDEKELRYSISQVFMAGMFSISVVPNISMNFLGADLKDKTERRAYLKHLIYRVIDE